MIVNLIERIYSFLWGDLLQIPLPGGGSVGISLLIMAGAFVASCVFEVNVVYIVIICGLLGVLRTCMSRKGAGK